jgi:hypothetical protein
MLTNPLRQPLDFIGTDRASLNRLDLLHTPIQASALKIVQLFLRQKISGEFAHSLIPKCKNSRGRPPVCRWSFYIFKET